jgi:hypothetical protein
LSISLSNRGCHTISTVTKAPQSNNLKFKSWRLPLPLEDLKGICSLLGRDVASADEFAVGMRILLGSLAAS